MILILLRVRGNSAEHQRQMIWQAVMEDILAQGTDKTEHVHFPDSQQHSVQCVCSDQFSVIVDRVDMIHLTHQGSIVI